MDNTLEMHPSNSTVQSYNFPISNSDDSQLIANNPPQLAPIDYGSQPSSIQSPPAQQISQNQQPLGLGQQLQNAQQAYVNYQNYGQKHPILASFFGQVSPQDRARQADQAQKIQMLQAMQQQQAAAATNQTNLGQYNALAPKAGLPTAIPGSVIDDKQIAGLQSLVQKYGAPTLMKARDQYNTDLANYMQKKQEKLTYDTLKQHGILPKGAVDPGEPEKPEFNIEGINPYLDAGTVSGVTGQSGEFAKTGEEAGKNAETDAEKSEYSKNLFQARKEALDAKIEASKALDEYRNKRIDELSRHNSVIEGQGQERLNQGEQRIHQGDQRIGQGGQRLGLEQDRNVIGHLKESVNADKNLLDTITNKGKNIPHPNDPEYQAYQSALSDMKRDQATLSGFNAHTQYSQSPQGHIPVGQPSHPTKLNLKGANSKTLSALSKIGL